MDIEHSYVNNVESLIPRPDIALDVLTIAHEEDCSVARLAGKIEKDPSLTANMLRLANSSYYGYMHEITSIHDIIVRLGLNTVKLMAISSASLGILKTPQDAYLLEPGELWNHSYGTAVVAESIGDFLGIYDISALFTAALLHDVGKIILNRPLQLAAGDRPGENTAHGLADERKLLHTDHAIIGRALLATWRLPDLITQPIGLHHRWPDAEAAGTHSRIVYFANWLTNTTNFHHQPEDVSGAALAADLDGKQELQLMPRVAANLAGLLQDAVRRFNQTAAAFEL